MPRWSCGYITSMPFQHDQLWRCATDFKTNTGKQLGVKLTRRAPGLGEREVHFDPAKAMEEKIIVSLTGFTGFLSAGA